MCSSEICRKALEQTAEKYPHVQICEFTDDLMSYIDAADAIVSMGGYNTVSEILSLGKRAVIVPRVKPVKEQWIRAERLAHLGLLRMIHPDNLTPKSLIDAILEELTGSNSHFPHFCSLNLDALPQVTSHISNLLSSEVQSSNVAYLYQKSIQPRLATG